jgi:hypothetical protein
MTDFGKAVADEYRKLRAEIAGRQVKSNEDGTIPPAGAIDGQVKEQIVADIDHLIEKNDPPKSVHR